MNVEDIISLYRQGKTFKTDLNLIDPYATSVCALESLILSFAFIGSRLQIDTYHNSKFQEVTFTYMAYSDLGARVFNQVCKYYEGLQGFKISCWDSLGYFINTPTSTHLMRLGSTFHIVLDDRSKLLDYTMFDNEPKVSPPNINRHPICLSCPYYAKNDYLWCTLSPLGYGGVGCDPSESTSVLKFLV